MGCGTYEFLLAHVGHKVACVSYGIEDEPPYNVALECEDCHLVLVDFNRPDMEEDDGGSGDRERPGDSRDGQGHSLPDQGEEVWVPRSQIKENSDVKDAGDDGTLVVSEWFAQKEGLD